MSKQEPVSAVRLSGGFAASYLGSSELPVGACDVYAIHREDERWSLVDQCTIVRGPTGLWAWTGDCWKASEADRRLELARVLRSGESVK